MYSPVSVWTFEHAPEEYKNLSPHGGDEDFVAFVPLEAWEAALWMLVFDEGTYFGCCSVSWHDVEGGKVAIGCHA